MARLHYAEGRAPGEALFIAVCGWLVPTATNRPELVTCKLCKKKLRKLPTLARKPVPRSPFDFEIETDLPTLTPSTWRRRDCECNQRGSCEVCAYFKRLDQEEHERPYKESTQLHVKREYRWGSVRKALTWYADTVDDGFPIANAAGLVQKIGKMGGRIQETANANAHTEDLVDGRLVISKALAAAYAEPRPNWPAPPICVSILLRRLVGAVSPETGKHERVPTTAEEIATAASVAKGTVGWIVRRGSWTVYEHLRGARLIPRARR